LLFFGGVWGGGREYSGRRVNVGEKMEKEEEGKKNFACTNSWEKKGKRRTIAFCWVEKKKTWGVAEKREGEKERSQHTLMMSKRDRKK